MQEKNPEQKEIEKTENEKQPKKPGNPAGIAEEKLDVFSEKETEKLVHSFQDYFKKCVEACKKPNILITGITGSGKSTLINSIFGKDLAKAGAGIPVTSKFQKFAPENQPIVIYDSKGLEYNEHDEFIRETKKFFNTLRSEKELSNHIHCVWYVLNCGRGRIDPFEIKLIKEVFNSTPMLIILNKADLADSKQITELMKVIKNEKLHEKGIYITIAERTQWTQSWCPDPECLNDDVFYDEETQSIECLECGKEINLKKTYGLENLIQITCDLLPEMAKDSFMYCQQISQQHKDRRGKEIVRKVTKVISLDVGGKFVKQIAELFAKLFVLWGYPLTADKFKKELESVQEEYIKKVKFSERFVITSLDNLFKKKISRGFTALLGMFMNKAMKKLNDELIAKTKAGKTDELNMETFLKHSEADEKMTILFFETVLFKSVDQALDDFWNITKEEIEEKAKTSKILGEGGIMAQNEMQDGDIMDLFKTADVKGVDADQFEGLSEEEKLKKLLEMQKEKEKQKENDEKKEENDEDEDEDDDMLD